MKIKMLALVLFPLLFGNINAQTPIETFSLADDISIQTHPDNGADFANAIVSYKGSIYYGYIDGLLNGCIAKKDPNGVLTTVIVRPGMILDNHHFEVSIAIDAEGYIHWAGDMHQSPMVYYRSTNPEDISNFIAFNQNVANGGIYGPEAVSYGRFITSRRGTLMWVHRQRVGRTADGWVPGIMAGNIQVYNTDTKRWSQLGSLNYSFVSDKGVTITGGQDATHQTKAVFWDNSGAGTPPNNGYQGYKIRIVFDKNNRMHMVWNVAKNPVNPGISNTHTHLMYAYSDDEGVTWYKSNGTLLTLPITTNNGDVIYTEDPSINAPRMGNFCNIALTNDNKPILFQQSMSLNYVLVFRYNGTNWLDVSNSWTPAWFSEAITDGNGWLSVIAGGNTIRRSNDNGITFRNYPNFPISYNAGLMSFDDQYLLETGLLRYQHVTGATSTVYTINWQNSAPGQVPLPKITPLSGTTFTTNATVTIVCDDYNASIKYTTDGTTPTPTNGILYTGSFTITNNTTVKAVAYNPGLVNSRIAASQISKFVPDNSPPSIPDGLTASAIAGKKFTLIWNASTDNVGVTGYEVYRNGVLTATTIDTSLILTGLTELTAYAMRVKAFDAQSNYSALSNTLTVNTISDQANIFKASVAPVIDGTKDGSWNGTVYPLEINNAGVVENPVDLSSTWASTYDQDNLYFFVDVTDDNLSANQANWYQNDGVEFYIDATNRKGASYQSSDFQFNYMYGDTQLRERNRNSSTAGSEIVKANKTGGYRLEVKIPWTVLGILAPPSGYQIGLEVMVIDNDLGNWQGKLSWNNPMDNSWNNPSTFGVANLVTAPLPVKLFSFKGKSLSTGIQLNWQTASEENFNVFEVMRSTNSVIFETLPGQVPGGSRSYNYFDKNVQNGITYFYKLKMMDKDGRYEYSKIISVASKNTVVVSLEVYPNPVHSTMNVALAGVPVNKTVSLNLADMNGKILSSHRVTQAMTTLDINALVAGNYVLTAWVDGQIVAMQKVAKQ